MYFTLPFLLYLNMNLLIRNSFFYLCLALLLLSCSKNNDEFNPQNLSNDDIQPPITNRLHSIKIENIEQSILLNSVLIEFEEDSITRRLLSKLTVSTKTNEVTIYEPEYKSARLTKLIDRTGNDQDIEIEYIFDSKSAKHLVSKIKYFKKVNPYAIELHYNNSTLSKISAFEINGVSGIVSTKAFDTIDSVESQFQYTDFENPFRLSNDIFAIVICFSDFDDSYTKKLSRITRFIPLYAYKKLPYSYLNSKYIYDIDFDNSNLDGINYRVISQNPAFLADYNFHFSYRY